MPSNASISSSPAPAVLVRAFGRAPEIVAFEESVVGFFVQAADMLGVPKSVAALYGIVFASPHPLSFADIERRLGLSKGSISQGLRVLRGMGAIKEVSTPKDRAELFSPDMEMRRLIQRFLELRLQQQLEAGRSRLLDVQRAIPAWQPAEAEILLSRLAQLQAWHDKARALLPIARRFLKLVPG